MKIVYIAHPIRGDVHSNVQKVIDIVKNININEPNVVPFAPYISDVLALNDEVEVERNRGFKNNKSLFETGIINELRLYGPTISEGMRKEMRWAKYLGIRTLNFTDKAIYRYSKNDALEMIINAIISVSGLTIEEITSSKNYRREVSIARQIIIGLYINCINQNIESKKQKKDSINIKKKLNYKNHSSVLYSYKVYKNLVYSKSDPLFNQYLENVKKQLEL